MTGPSRIGHVEVLDAFDRIRLDRGTDALAHDVQQIHEDLIPQQLIHLLLTGVVALHEALDGARLVAAVVVDVHRRVGRVALDDEVDEALEGLPLRIAVVPPDGQVVGRPVADGHQAEQVLEAEAEVVLDGPRIGLDVEEDVERRRCRESGEALVGLIGVRLDELVEQPAGVLALRPGCVPVRARAPGFAG